MALRMRPHIISAYKVETTQLTPESTHLVQVDAHLIGGLAEPLCVGLVLALGVQLLVDLACQVHTLLDPRHV